MALSSRVPPAGRSNAYTSRSRPTSAIEPSVGDIPDQTQQSDGDALRKAKRRSLLPQFTRKVSADEKESRIPIEEAEVEDFNGGNGYKRSGSDDDKHPAEERRRTAIDADRRAMPPPASRLSRPTSIIPPRGVTHTGGMQQQSKSHTRARTSEKNIDVEGARADSLAALTGGARTETSKVPGADTGGLKRSGSTRLPQSPKPGAPSIPSRTTSMRTAETHSRASATGNKLNAGHGRKIGSIAENAPPSEKRSSVARPRPRSIVSPSLNVAEDVQKSPPRGTATSRSGLTPQLAAPAPQKPGFNSFQQHYSPAKSSLPKAPIPPPKAGKTISSPVEVDAGMTMTSDITFQQLELLQLSLLHEASAKTTQEYTTSAKRKLGRKHVRLRKEYESIRATELVHQRAANLSALETWCADPSMLVENLQILSLVHSDLEALLGAGSRQAEVVAMFERWVGEESQTSRSHDFIYPLSDEWRNMHSSVTLKLRGIQRNLGVLPPASPALTQDESGLEVVLKGCKTLVDGLLRELEMMIKLEKEILAKERIRVDDEVRMVLIDDVTDGKIDAWKPAWQTVHLK